MSISRTIGNSAAEHLIDFVERSRASEGKLAFCSAIGSTKYRRKREGRRTIGPMDTVAPGQAAT